MNHRRLKKDYERPGHILIAMVFQMLTQVSQMSVYALVIFNKFSPSTAGSHFQRTRGEKLKLLHFSNNWPLSVRCPLTIRARTSGRNFAKFDQRGRRY